MPLARRLPKRGFHNIFAKPLEAVNVSVLEKFEDGAVVNAQALLEKGVLSKCEYGVKILGNGSITKKLTVQASSRLPPSPPLPRKKLKLQVVRRR